MRREIADQLALLEDEQLASPSLCEGWDVLTVGAHLAASVTVAVPRRVASVVWHGGSLRRASDRRARRMRRRRQDIVDVLRANADRHLASPRNGPVAPMTEAMVHAGDIFRPLGVAHELAAEPVFKALDFLTAVRPVGLVGRRRLTGLWLIADDLDFDAGEGKEVRGDAADLMMAVCGRASALPLLRGAGVDILRSRLVHHKR
jgi:uncharacterized protein (TIGR03083 family)